MESFNKNYIEEFDTLDELLEYLSVTENTFKTSGRDIKIEKVIINKLESSKYSMVLNIQYDERK